MHTVYVGWSETHPVVQRFWRVMSELSNKDRSQFLRFAWGRSRLPKTSNWPRPFKLCMKEEGNAVQLFVCNNGITLYRGSELFEDRLGLSDGLKAVTYEDEDSWYDGEEDIHILHNLDAVKTLIAAMDEAAFQLSDQADLYEEKKDGGLSKELYHVYCKLDNGVTVTLRLFQGGYVTFTGLPDACVQVPEATFDAFLAALK